MSKELLIFLIFLFISCFFWVLQSLQEVSEAEFDIPISYSQIPATVSITNKLPKTVRITLRDKGTNLFYYQRNLQELTIHLNLMTWYRKDRIAKIPISIFNSNLRNRLRSTTQMLNVQPETISVYFVEKASKSVPIHLNYRLKLLSQHQLADTPIINPSFVTVYAPIDVLTKLNQVETTLLEIQDLEDSIQVFLKLKPIHGVRFSTSKVSVKFSVEEFTERSISIPVTGTRFPEGKYLLCFPPSVTVTFFVGLSAFHSISEKDFSASVDFSSLMNSVKRSQKVVLTKSPLRIRNVRIQPSFVDCLIEKR